MKSFVLIISSLMIAFFSFGQLDSNCVQLGVLKMLPMRNAESYECKSPAQGGGNFLFVESIIDSVFSLRDGKIGMVSKDPHENELPVYMVGIRDSSEGFIYINLINPQFKEGEIVKKGSLIGFASKSIKTNKHFLILMMINGIIKDSPPFDVDDIWKLIKDE